MPVIVKAFGQLQDGRPVDSVVLLNARSGFCVEVLPYGATLRAIKVPTRDGRLVDAVLSYDRLADYEHGNAYLGATIGRLAGRTAINGNLSKHLTRNESGNHLHGGSIGFSHSLWDVVDIDESDQPAIRLRHHSPSGEDGCPGDVSVDVEFALVDDLQLRVVMNARSDSDTPLNLTHHPYFNLNGDAASTIDDHRLRIAAERILPIATTQLPTGDMLDVAATPFDFREARAIGASHYDGHAQLQLADGYDHYYVLDHDAPVAADLFSPTSSLGVRMTTNQPGLQFYSGNRLDTAAPIAFRARSGVCLEPHAFPDAINRPNFPDITLRAGEHYRHETSYEFYLGAT